MSLLCYCDILQLETFSLEIVYSETEIKSTVRERSDSHSRKIGFNRLKHELIDCHICQKVKLLYFYLSDEWGLVVQIHSQWKLVLSLMSRLFTFQFFPFLVLNVILNTVFSRLVFTALCLSNYFVYQRYIPAKTSAQLNHMYLIFIFMMIWWWLRRWHHLMNEFISGTFYFYHSDSELVRELIILVDASTAIKVRLSQI